MCSPMHTFPGEVEQGDTDFFIHFSYYKQMLFLCSVYCHDFLNFGALLLVISLFKMSPSILLKGYLVFLNARSL